MNRYNNIIIYHWGHAEKTYIENIHKRFPDIILPNMKLIDLAKYIEGVIKETIIGRKIKVRVFYIWKNLISTT